MARLPLFAAALCCWLVTTTSALAERLECDVLVYGATPGGIAAALAAADDGENVILVEPTNRIGGLVTCGLSHTDYHAQDGLTGSFLQFSKRVEAYYVKKYGPDSQQVKDSWRGTFGEPHVNLLIFEQMLAERKNIRVVKELTLQTVVTDRQEPRSTDRDEIHSRTQITLAKFRSANAAEVQAAAEMFIDASYEGDLMATAGAKYRVGREARDEYGESLAPEKADDQLQAYNFRFIMTQAAEHRVTPLAPPGYNADDFLPIVDMLESGKIKAIFGYPNDCIFKAQLPPLPNGKHDINDVSKSAIRLSLPGINRGWPDGDRETRAKIFTEHRRDQEGLLYFLQNDERVPAKFRDEARTWGWCKDEFESTGHLPPQLYVREARRMVGMHVFTQSDCENAPGDARAKLFTDAIAMGEYGNNCHGTAHEGPRFGGKHTGDFYHATPPYQIPYGVIIPTKGDNLLVPVAASASHVGFCALRLEPIWMSLGEAAGHAAHFARKAKGKTRDRSIIPQIQARLHATGAATIYFSDVLPGDADFAAAQWLGTAGGFHGILGKPAKVRGKGIVGQYSESYPSHTADLDQPLDEKLAAKWNAIAAAAKIDVAKLPSADGKSTRRAWLQAAWKLR